MHRMHFAYRMHPIFFHFPSFLFLFPFFLLFLVSHSQPRPRWTTRFEITAEIAQHCAGARKPGNSHLNLFFLFFNSF
jgi:hypothetical protein